jgi:hypothetical protein
MMVVVLSLHCPNSECSISKMKKKSVKRDNYLSNDTTDATVDHSPSLLGESALRMFKASPQGLPAAYVEMCSKRQPEDFQMTIYLDCDFIVVFSCR